MKYIVLRVGNREVPIIFPNQMVHSMVVDVIKLYFANEADAVAEGGLSTKAKLELMDAIKPVSAGEVSVRVLAHGESSTLKLKSRPLIDTHLINGYDYFHGVVVEDGEVDDGRE